MGDILSQSEIDDLLRALDTGELDMQQMHVTTTEKKIKTHDFRRPSKFAKDHIRTLHIIHENYARLITNFLSGYLRTLVQVDVVSVEPLAYYEFNNSISNPVVLGIVNFSPLNGSIIFEIGANIAYALIDRILGGRGSVMDKIREFTEIELVIIERIMIQILNLMRDSWENIIEIRPRLEKIETNVQFAQIISPNEMVALVTLSARVGEVEGMLNICIPHMTVEPIMSKLSTRFWFSTVEKEITQETKENLQKRLEATKVPVIAILGKSYITVSDFLDLQVGDVVTLNTGVNNALEINVGNHLKFYGVPGVRKNRFAVKVTEVVRKEE